MSDTIRPNKQRKSESGLLCFQFDVEHGADECGELEVTLGLSCGFIDGGLRVGVSATDVGELLFVAGLEVVVELQGFFGCVVVGNMTREFHQALNLRYGLAFFGCKVRVLACAFYALWLSCLENLRGAVACFLPAVLVL